MKNYFYALLFLLVSNANAQNNEEVISQQFTKYSQLVIDKKIDEAMDYTNEDLFKIVPREQMKNLMESIFNMPTIEYRASLPQILKVEPIKNIDGANYARIQNKNVIEMKFKQSPEEPKRTEEEERENNKLLLASFQSKYSKENVSFDKASGFFKLTAVKTAIAKSTDLKNWKFVVVDNPRMKTMLESFIPKELLD